MKKNVLITVIAAVFILFIASSCDFGGPETYIYTVPSWLANKGDLTTRGTTVEDTRADAEVGQSYFYGVSATSDSITLIYKIKGTGTDAATDHEVRYKQEEVARMIDPSYEANPVMPDPSDPSGNSLVILASRQDKTPAAEMIIRRVVSEDITETGTYLYFDFWPTYGIGGYRILN